MCLVMAHLEVFHEPSPEEANPTTRGGTTKVTPSEGIEGDEPTPIKKPKVVVGRKMTERREGGYQQRLFSKKRPNSYEGGGYNDLYRRHQHKRGTRIHPSSPTTLRCRPLFPGMFLKLHVCLPIISLRILPTAVDGDRFNVVLRRN